MSSRVSGSRVEARMFAADDPLTPFVECFWVGSWDLTGQEPHTVELLSDPCVNIVFEAGASRVVGVWTSTWTRTLERRGVVRAAKLRAGASAAFIAEPADRLTDRLRPMAELLPWTRELERHVLDPPDHRDGVDRLQEWLTGRLRPDRPAELSTAMELMRVIAEDRSIVNVDTLAERAGLHLRALQRIFRAYVGAPPKWAIRRHRLQEAALRLESGEALHLARLAAELGYADHAHLTRDFTAAVGKPPSAFARDVHR